MWKGWSFRYNLSFIKAIVCVSPLYALSHSCTFTNVPTGNGCPSCSFEQAANVRRVKKSRCFILVYLSDAKVRLFFIKQWSCYIVAFRYNSACSISTCIAYLDKVVVMSLLSRSYIFTLVTFLSTSVQCTWIVCFFCGCFAMNVRTIFSWFCGLGHGVKRYLYSNSHQYNNTYHYCPCMAVYCHRYKS